MARMSEADLKALLATGTTKVDTRYSIIQRTPAAKAVIQEATKSLEATFADQVAKLGLPAPVAQFRFDDTPVGWRWDFAWPMYRLLVEINGGVYQDKPTGHRSIRGVVRDYAKLNAATARGWWSMAFESKAVESGDAVRVVEEFILTFDKLSKKGDPCE